MGQTTCKPTFVDLFLSFLRLGVTAFGGPSMVAYIERMAVEKKLWLDSKTFSDGVALCQMIPGATAMQMAAYVGLKTRGIGGAGVSFIAFGLPAFVMMMIFAALYSYAINLSAVISAFSGLQGIVVAIIAYATISFGKSTLNNWKSAFIALLSAGFYGLSINPILVILFSALMGLILMPITPQPHSDSPVYKERNYKKSILLIVLAFLVVITFLFFVDKTLFELALLMLRIDLFAFGGGFSSIPLMYHEVVEVRRWIDGYTFMNGIILGQITPGPIVITATFIGYLLAGLKGGIVATLCIFLPSFLMVIAISPYFDQLRSSAYFSKVIRGVFCSFVGLLMAVFIRFAFEVSWDLSRLLLSSAALVALFLKVDIIWIILLSSAISIVLLR